MGVVTIYMFDVIRLPVFVLGSLLWIFSVQEWLCHCAWSISVLLWIRLCIIQLCMNWHVYICYTMQSLFVLHFKSFFNISPVHGLFYHCVVVIPAFVLIYLWILYLCLLRYVCVLYTIYYLFWIHLERIAVYIY